jgi:hypothetical protein
MVDAHPALVYWATLAVGMLLILFWTAHDADLRVAQWMGLALACVAWGGLCAWIIHWA